MKRRGLARPALFLVVLGCLLANAGTGRAVIIERIVAVVNKQVVLLSELYSRIGPMAQKLKQIPDKEMREKRFREIKAQALEAVIGEKLIEQEAAKLKLTVSEKDLERAISQVMKRNKLSRDQLEAALAQEGKSIAQYKRILLRPQLLRYKVINTQVRSRVNVSDDEIKARYQNNLRRLGADAKVRARHIFFAIPATATGGQVRQIKGRAETVLKLLRKGADFGAMAKKHSNDSATREDGGDLEFFGRGTLPTRVEDIVFAMKKGQISDVLRAERGFHIIQVTDRRESTAKPLNQVRDSLFNQIYGEKMEKATKAWLKDVRKRAYVDIRL